MENTDVLTSTQDSDESFGITFPDGEHIPVSLRQTSYRYPTGVTSLANEYGRLVEDALNGDVATAHYLYKSLRRCGKPEFANEADLEAAITEFYQTERYTTSDGINVGVSGGPNVREGVEESLREEFAFCVGVDQRDLSDFDHWRDLAIENGHVGAALSYDNGLLRRSPERVTAYKKAFELGSINAAGHVSIAYKEGWPGQEPDLVQAYAYAYIHANLFQAYAPKKYHQRADYNLNQIVNTMPLYQMDEAVALAKEILTSNPECCIGNPFQN